MKNTVKTWPKGTKVQTFPMGTGYVGLVIIKSEEGKDDEILGVALTPDQAGALIFGMEQALEAGEVAQQRAAHAEIETEAEAAARKANATGQAVLGTVTPVPFRAPSPAAYRPCPTCGG